mgnify:CR=1 FL=1
MEKRVATFTVHRAADMSPAGRHEIAEWLRKQAVFLETEGENLAPTFTARWIAR